MKTRQCGLMLLFCAMFCFLVCLASASPPGVDRTDRTTLDVHLPSVDGAYAPTGMTFSRTSTITYRAQAATSTGASWSFASAFNPKGKTWSEVVTHREGELVALFGRTNWNLEVDTFAGVDSTTGRAVGGVGAIARGNIAKNAAWLLGPGVFLESNRPVSAGLLVGASVQF